jgi:muramoyltetrapeptide carboxypeptidase LdcA involved in peptidoglycan recycling
MTVIKTSILAMAGVLLLAGPAVADDVDTPEVTAEQRQQAMEARREAMRKLPPEQRAIVREAHRKAMMAEGGNENCAGMQQRKRGGGQHKGHGKGHRGG